MTDRDLKEGVPTMFSRGLARLIFGEESKGMGFCACALDRSSHDRNWARIVAAIDRLHHEPNHCDAFWRREMKRYWHLVGEEKSVGGD